MSTKISMVLTLAAMALGGAGCASSTDSGEKQDAVVAGDEASSDEPGADAPRYAVRCDGSTAPLHVGAVIALAPKCVGGEPGTRCGDDACAAQSVRFSYAKPGYRCSGTVYSWDGAACLPQETSTSEGALQCAGEDCLALFPSKEACQSAHVACTAD